MAADIDAVRAVTALAGLAVATVDAGLSDDLARLM
jgi:hypothetical protein